MSVNVSPSTLVQQGDELAGVAASSPRPLVLELTEYDPIRDHAAVEAAVARIGPQVRLSLDLDRADHPSLRRVVDLGRQLLRLGRSWIGSIEADRGRQALVASLVTFTRHMRVDLVAEGIDTAEKLGVLQGMRFGQGNLPGVLADRAAWGTPFGGSRPPGPSATKQ
jgi:EAL domain-containing protein (putative c-di-GMP-specific phosphodiesterase class I)